MVTNRMRRAMTYTPEINAAERARAQYLDVGHPALVKFVREFMTPVLIGVHPISKEWVQYANHILAKQHLGALVVQPLPGSFNLQIVWGLNLRGSELCDLVWGAGKSPIYVVRREVVENSESTSHIHQVIFAQVRQQQSPGVTHMLADISTPSESDPFSGKNILEILSNAANVLR